MISEEGKMKSPDYEIENYCSRCDEIYSKTEFQCKYCHHKLRTVPHAGIRRRKYIDKKPRM